MGLVHGQIQESNARTRLRLYERVANHVAWMLHIRVSALDACIRFHGCAIAFLLGFLHWIRVLLKIVKSLCCSDDDSPRCGFAAPSPPPTALNLGFAPTLRGHPQKLGQKEDMIRSKKQVKKPNYYQSTKKLIDVT